MTRFAFVVLAWSLWFGVGLSAQQAGQSSLRASLVREATRLASVPHEPSWDGSSGFNTQADQTGRSDDWDAVRQLKAGTRTVVTTRQDRRINGKLTSVSGDTLEMVVRWGRKQKLLRDDIREVRLGHRLSVGQHAGLGLLLGGVTGFLVGAPCSDCPVNVGFASGTFLGGIGGFVIGEAVHARPGRLVYARPRP